MTKFMLNNVKELKQRLNSVVLLSAPDFSQSLFEC